MIAFWIATTWPVAVALPTADDLQPYSCGACALTAFARSKHLNCELAEASRRLPAGVASFADIVGAGRHFGLELGHRPIRRAADVPQSSMILHFESIEGTNQGHFVFARPIGAKGMEYQIIDPEKPVRVLSASDLVGLPGFSGNVLVEIRWWERGATAKWRAAVGLAFATLLITFWRHWRRVHRPRSPREILQQ